MSNQSLRALETAPEKVFVEKAANENKLFAHDVLEGLTSRPKKLPSKYFYDKTGDGIFQEIMHLPEYYLTRSEFEILEQNKEAFLEFFRMNGSFNLIEFGAGDGLKTKILLQHFSEQNTRFRYIPIDISGHVLKLLADELKQQLPSVETAPLQGDYFLALNRLGKTRDGRKVVLFLGSNIGNFTDEEAIRFLQAMGKNMNTGDLALIGFDLKKDPEVIRRAYNGETGVTRAFNLNLLSRINRELQANFDLDKFMHYPSYDPVCGEARSYLISKTEQEVYIGSLAQSFHFKAWEAVHVEISRKYDTTTIGKYAAAANFVVKELFYDRHHLYVNALWEKV